jgi:molybdate transport system regulatory protein
VGKKPPSHRQQPQRLRIRARLWIETSSGVALTDAGADLLEQIDAWGSLSEAARRLRFSYRRAWMLLDTMNRRLPEPLVKLATGGRHGGGARLTEAGHVVLRTYRDLQLRLEHFVGEAESSLPTPLHPKPSRRVSSKRSRTR